MLALSVDAAGKKLINPLTKKVMLTQIFLRPVGQSSRLFFFETIYAEKGFVWGVNYRGHKASRL